MKKIIIPLFLFLILILSSIIIAEAPIEITDACDNLNPNSIVIDSNGYYYTFYLNNSGNYTILKSTDNGTSWNSVADFSGGDDYTITGVIDNNDIIHLLYLENAGDDLNYRAFGCAGDSLSSEIILDGNAGNTVDLEYVIGINRYNDILIVYRRQLTDETCYFFNDHNTGVWSTRQTFNSSDYEPLAIDSDSQGDFWIFCHNKNNNDDFYLFQMQMDGTFDIDCYDIAIDISAGANYWSGDMIIDTSDRPCFVYANDTETTDSTIWYGYIYGQETIDEIFQYEVYNVSGIDAYLPSLSYDDEQYHHITFSTEYLGNRAIVGYRSFHSDYDEWTDFTVYAVSTGDSLTTNSLMYQRYPLNCRMEDGIIGVGHNSTDDDLQFFYNGTLIMYGEDDADVNDTLKADFEWWDDNYGDLFVEFNKYWIECFWSMGEYPDIVYRLPINDSAVEWDDNWRYNISMYFMGTQFNQGSSGAYISSRIIGGNNNPDTSWENITLGEHYLGSLPYEGIYELRVYNVTLYDDQDGPVNSTDRVYTSNVILVCGEAQMNSYDYSITPSKNEYTVNETVSITVYRLSGDEAWSYRLVEPHLSDTEMYGSGLTGSTYNFSYTFSDANTYYYWSQGDWYLYVYDTYGDYNDANALRIKIKVVPDDYVGYTIGDIDFWVGLGLILVFTFIGIGVATKLDSDAQLGVILLFSTIGGIVSSYYALIPTYGAFLIGLILIGYIIATVFGNRR